MGKKEVKSKGRGRDKGKVSVINWKIVVGRFEESMRESVAPIHQLL